MKISYLYGSCARNDAISNAIRHEVASLVRSGLAEVKLYAFHCDHDDLPFEQVGSVGDVLLSSHFQESDLVICHFGIYHPLFDLLAVTPKRMRKLVVFHNITPKQFVPADQHPLIERSLSQMSNIVWADHVICVSETNLGVLREAGISTPATVLGLAVDSDLQAPARKPSHVDGVVRIAFVGRMVNSKGPLELLKGLEYVLANGGALANGSGFQLDLIGNLNYSDARVTEQVRLEMTALNKRFAGRVNIQLHGNAPEAIKQKVLQEADLFVLPTYHEGFCVPIVEALSSGCLVVTYDNSNTPAVSGDLAILVETGNQHALNHAILAQIARLQSNDWTAEGQGSYRTYVERCRQHVAGFSPEHTERAFLRFLDKWMLPHI
ncbi:glycosyltransferase family 4 protein [Cupriavidus necator]|uniref:Glycosyltransferase n=1 Tax=Cupriavidus necator TaxID=106590 RepID=A0A367PFV9_CUPNE|nr:glycosyltransferase family 4 protein [Cupriavidus necator]QQX83631.1 glycosyltransferase family 4 protein [Cupriavidus necator]RCJ06760.1 glycosyltransferase [Cupriavidus necator]